MSIYRIAICNPKGGVGKTTLALNLATMLLKRGMDVTLIDLDQQASLRDCIRQRPDKMNKISCLSYSVDDFLDSEHMHKHCDNDSYLIIDCPAGISEKQVVALIAGVDKLIIPANPSYVDINALIHHVFRLAEQDKDFSKKAKLGLVVNRAKPFVNSHRLVIDWYDHIAIPKIGELRDTINYSLSTQYGIGISEMPIKRVEKDIGSWEKIYDWATH